MSQQVDVCVSIATWNSLDLLGQCIEHLIHNTKHTNYSLWVIDNASTDGTSDLVEDRFPNVNLIKLSVNRGAVGAFNCIISEVAADHYIRLDTDAFVYRGWLKPLVKTLERSGRIGFASPKFLYPDGRIHYAGASFSRRFGIKVIGHGEPDSGQYDTSHPVTFAHAMCLTKREVIENVGPLDEGFIPGYYEEFDYQLRARRKGFVAWYVPESTIIHGSSQTWKRRSRREKVELMNRNWFRLLALHWPIHWLLFRIPLECVRILGEIVSNRIVSPYLPAGIKTVKSLGELLTKRREINQVGRMPLPNLLEGP